jgi:hypothetical protein
MTLKSLKLIFDIRRIPAPTSERVYIGGLPPSLPCLRLLAGREGGLPRVAYAGLLGRGRAADCGQSVHRDTEVSVGIGRGRPYRRPGGAIFANRPFTHPPRKKRSPRRSNSRLGRDAGSTRDINSLSRCSSRKRASRALWSISTRAAFHHQRSGLNMIVLHAAAASAPCRWRRENGMRQRRDV